MSGGTAAICGGGQQLIVAGRVVCGRKVYCGRIWLTAALQRYWPKNFDKAGRFTVMKLQRARELFLWVLEGDRALACERASEIPRENRQELWRPADHADFRIDRGAGAKERRPLRASACDVQPVWQAVSNAGRKDPRAAG